MLIAVTCDPTLPAPSKIKLPALMTPLPETDPPLSSVTEDALTLALSWMLPEVVTSKLPVKEDGVLKVTLEVSMETVPTLALLAKVMPPTVAVPEPVVLRLTSPAVMAPKFASDIFKPPATSPPNPMLTPSVALMVVVAVPLLSEPPALKEMPPAVMSKVLLPVETAAPRVRVPVPVLPESALSVSPWEPVNVTAPSMSILGGRRHGNGSSDRNRASVVQWRYSRWDWTKSTPRFRSR